MGWFAAKVRGEIEMIWACAEKGYGLYWKKNAEDGTARKEKKEKAKEELYGYGEGRHAGVWCDRVQIEMETKKYSAYYSL